MSNPQNIFHNCHFSYLHKVALSEQNTNLWFLFEISKELTICFLMNMKKGRVSIFHFLNLFLSILNTKIKKIRYISSTFMRLKKPWIVHWFTFNSHSMLEVAHYPRKFALQSMITKSQRFLVIKVSHIFLDWNNHVRSFFAKASVNS